MYLFGPSLAVALLDELFEHPAGYFPFATDAQTIDFLACQHSFSAAC